jgi:NADH-quinone oxidoreductase subunit L
LVTAGFWSKDEILADAFAHNPWVFLTLALAALLTAFYTMRQITLTFLGEARTKAAEHASETPWTMTGPLVILSVFAIGFGWAGIPEHFPGLGGLIPNWFHHFVGATLIEEPESLAFNFIPLATSLGVALGGLSLGWLVYRNAAAGEPDPLEKMLGPVHPLLKNKYYFDEIYSVIFIKPMIWVSEVFTSQWMDRGLIDGILHTVARVAVWIGTTLRFRFDLPVINEFFGDGTATVTQRIGRALRFVQTGRIQTYLISSLAALVVLGAALYFFLPK